MQTLTYRQAYDKIIEAYFKDEIRPFDAEFCFCGTLNNNDSTWIEGSACSAGYFGHELLSMEMALFVPLQHCGLRLLNTKLNNTNGIMDWRIVKIHPDYEDALFEGMCAALDVLKEIHRSRGENVDEEIPAFTKRELKPVV